MSSGRCHTTAECHHTPAGQVNSVKRASAFPLQRGAKAASKQAPQQSSSPFSFLSNKAGGTGQVKAGQVGKTAKIKAGQVGKTAKIKAGQVGKTAKIKAGATPKKVSNLVPEKLVRQNVLYRPHCKARSADYRPGDCHAWELMPHSCCMLCNMHLELPKSGL